MKTQILFFVCLAFASVGFGQVSAPKGVKYGDNTVQRSAFTPLKDSALVRLKRDTISIDSLFKSSHFTGIPTAPTAANGTNTTQLATTAFVMANATGITGVDSFKYNTTRNRFQYKKNTTWYTIAISDSVSKLSLTDNFNSYTAGNLGGQGNWVAAQVNMTVVDVAGNKQITPNAGNRNLLYRSEAFTANQSSKITLTALVNASYVGPAVRVAYSGGVAYGYLYYIEPYNRYLKYFNVASGVAGTTIASATSSSSSVGDTFTIEASGSTIKCYKNGVLDTGLTGGTGIFTDTNVPASGKPGIGGYTNGATNLDNWEGKDL